MHPAARYWEGRRLRRANVDPSLPSASGWNWRCRKRCRFQDRDRLLIPPPAAPRARLSLAHKAGESSLSRHWAHPKTSARLVRKWSGDGRSAKHRSRVPARSCRTPPGITRRRTRYATGLPLLPSRLHHARTAIAPCPFGLASHHRTWRVHHQRIALLHRLHAPPA